MRGSTWTSVSAALLVFGTPAPGALAAAAPPDAPQAFVTKAAQAGLAEVELAKLAATSSGNEAVKSFATRMLNDHGKANTELTAIARQKGLTVPAQPDPSHAQLVQAMKGKSGADFDSAYAMHMVMDHIEAVALFEANSTSKDAELAAFAGRTLPVLREHKRLADSLNTRTPPQN